MTDIAGDLTTTDLWARAERDFGDRTFLVHLGSAGQRREYTYARFAGRVHQAAHALRHLGVRAGDTVVLHLGNSPEFLTCLFGLADLGAVAVPVGPHATRAELCWLYLACGARWAVVEADRLGDHVAACHDQGGLLVVHRSGVDDDQVPDADAVHTPSFEDLCDAQPTTAPPRAVTADGLAEVLYTSGTTAEPKGVMITHANLVFSGHYGIWQASLRADDRLFTTMPACHSNFQLAALTPVLVAGATLVVAERYSAHRFWSLVRHERATVVQLVAMMIRTLLRQPPGDHDTDHQVREAMFFMPLSDEEKAEAEARFGLRLTNSYGSTESIGWAVTDPPTGERRWPSVGRAGLGYEVGVFDPHGRELPPGEVGELRIKGTPGRSLMLGYFADPAATTAALSPDGWLRTHDQGYQDTEGWFYFVDRSVDLIKRAGENISATEVEKVLTSHPLIAEAAVVGVDDPVRDQLVKAFVRLAPGARLTTDDIVSHCRGRLACFKVPEVVELVADFPRTSSHKILKRRLGQGPVQGRNT